jgi:OmcA/MtrC family decaheme c-type cytochrome
MMALAATGIAACSGGSKGGSTGPVGPTGPTGPTGSGETIAISQAETIITTVTDATVAAGTNVATVTFTLQDGEGNGLAGLRPANVRFTVAKLIPGENGASSEWRSYISRVNNPDPNATPVPPATPAADQVPTEYATYEQGVATVSGVACTPTGVLEDLGGGSYRYTLSKGLPDYAGVSYDASQTQRVGLQIRGDATCAPGANTDKLLELAGQSLITNGVRDFVPAGGLPVSQNVIDEQQCDACHVQLAAHGGGRTSYDFCVTCHNPFTVQSATDTSFDMGFMTHQIHMAGNLATPFPIWEPADGADPGQMEYPFEEVTYPQDVRNCLSCHNDGDSGSSWKTAVTIANCGSCHDTTTYDGASPTHGGGPATEDQCSACHVQSNLPELSVAGAHDRSIAPYGTPPSLYPSTPAVREYSKRFEFEIVSVNAGSFAVGAFPQFTFRITDPTNGDTAYDLYSSPSFSGAACSTGTARLSFDIGWSTTDYTNAGSGYADFLNGAVVPGQPIQLNPLAGCPATGTAPGVVANGDGTYTMTSPVAIPAGVTGTAIVGFEGHPAGDLDGDGSYTDRIWVKNVYKLAAVTGTSPVERRTVVDIARCNACHAVLSLHGSNRSDEPQVCVICHNPAATDINKRRNPATGTPTMVADPAACPNPTNGNLVSTLDGRCEQSIDMKRMIHQIHAAEAQPSDQPLVIYGFGYRPIDFAEVTYPASGAKLGQCQSCHEPDTYYPVDPSVTAATTVDTGATLELQTDDYGITPNTSVCSGCHTDSTSALHMTQNGGSFSALKSNASGVVNSPFETCSVCHGAGGVADVKTAHKVGIYDFDNAPAN